MDVLVDEKDVRRAVERVLGGLQQCLCRLVLVDAVQLAQDVTELRLVRDLLQDLDLDDVIYVGPSAMHAE